MPDESTQSPDHAVTRFVEQLLLVTSPLQSIVNHMLEFQAAGRSAPDAPPVEVVLAELLEGTLAALIGRHGQPAVEAAAAVLEDAGETISSEIFIVRSDHDRPSAGANGSMPREA
jgi:hypothetical protein